jgi:hypothetical protein
VRIPFRGVFAQQHRDDGGEIRTADGRIDRRWIVIDDRVHRCHRRPSHPRVAAG